MLWQIVHRSCHNLIDLLYPPGGISTGVGEFANVASKNPKAFPRRASLCRLKRSIQCDQICRIRYWHNILGQRIDLIYTPALLYGFFQQCWNFRSLCPDGIHIVLCRLLQLAGPYLHGGGIIPNRTAFLCHIIYILFYIRRTLINDRCISRHILHGSRQRLCQGIQFPGTFVGRSCPV